MSEERFWNTNESISTAKFVALDGAMTMRQAGRLLLKPVSALPEHFLMAERRAACVHRG